MKSSPGYPYNTMVGATTNQELLSNYFAFIVQAVVDRVMLLAHTDYSVVDALSAEDKIKHGFCDPNLLFIKGDPHSLSKLAQGRYRLIFHVSFVDSLVERFFAQTQNKAEISMWDKIPSKPGFGVCPEHIKRLLKSFETKNPKGMTANDVIQFDWTMQDRDFLAEANARIALMQDMPDESCSLPMQNLIRNTFCVARDKLVIFKDGTCSKLEGCVWPSGRYCTSSTNSRRRTMMLHYMHCRSECDRLILSPREYWRFAKPFDTLRTSDGEVILPSCHANGDDAIELSDWYSDDAKKYYFELGADVKEEHTFQGEEFSFCSTTIGFDGSFYSTNMPKTMVKYLDGTQNQEQQAAIYEMCKDHPDGQYLEIFRRADGLRNGSKEGSIKDGEAVNHLNQQNTATDDSESEVDGTQSGEEYR
jgi:hypothetical protein